MKAPANYPVHVLTTYKIHHQPCYPVRCSDDFLLNAKELERIAARDEKKGKDASSTRALARGWTFLAYNMLADGTDYVSPKYMEVMLGMRDRYMSDINKLHDKLGY